MKALVALLLLALVHLVACKSKMLCKRACQKTHTTCLAENQQRYGQDSMGNHFYDTATPDGSTYERLWQEANATCDRQALVCVSFCPSSK